MEYSEVMFNDAKGRLNGLNVLSRDLSFELRQRATYFVRDLPSGFLRWVHVDFLLFESVEPLLSRPRACSRFANLV